MSTPKGTLPWNAGKGKGWTDKRGYRWVYVTENGRRRAKREHRHIMENHIGRRLEPWELVHHKNGDTADNRVENLEIQEFGPHTVFHSTNRRHHEDSRRSMEAFALLREELKRERVVKNGLLAACERALEVLESEKEMRDLAHDGDYVRPVEAAIELATAAIAKAKGGAA